MTMIPKTYTIPPNLQQKITAEQAFHYRIVPVKDSKEGIVLKTDSDALTNLLTELQIVLDTQWSYKNANPTN